VSESDGIASSHIALADHLFVREVKPMNVGYPGAIHRRAAAAGIVVITLGLVDAIGASIARAQHGANQLPNQPVGKGSNPFSAAYGQGRYTPYPVTDPTAAERAMVASRVYSTILDGWVQRAVAEPGPVGGRPDDDALFSLELAERLGMWSLRWQDAQDNAAKSSAARYQSLSDHLARMRSLEDGRVLREAAERAGLLKGRRLESKPPRLFGEIARFFRPIDERGVDRVVPEIVNFERPLNPLGVAVTAGERVEIAGRAYRAIMDASVGRFLASPPAGGGRRDDAPIFGAPLAERLANWSDRWRQAEDDAATDPSSRLAVNRNGSTRLALSGTRMAGPDALASTVKSHLERMTALETGRFQDDALKRADRPLPREFVAAARFFRVEAEGQLAGLSKPSGTDLTASSRSAAAGQIYQQTLDDAAHRYLALPRAGGAPADAGLVFDSRLAERLGAWSICWARVQAGWGEGPGSRFAASRSHFDRMASLEDGRALHEALKRAGQRAAVSDALPVPREFADAVRYFRLQARWELELVRSR
jgi:hypothetical protein